GTGQDGVRAIHTFTVRAITGEELVIHGDGSQIRAWCYIDDMIEALLLVLGRDEAVGETFNVGNTRSTVTVLDLAQRIKRLTGSESEIVSKPLHYTDVEIRIPNVDKARRLLDFEAKADLDEGLAPAYTFPATANAVALTGARPVLVDVDPETMNVDPGRVYDAVTPDTRAVMAVHLFGRPLDWEALQSAAPPDVALVEDAAGARGARGRGLPCGGLGMLGCLSFHPRKIVTTGEGGAVTTSDDAIAGAVRRLRHHGIAPRGDFEIPVPSTN